MPDNDDVEFDPYHKWLGIPRGHRPVTHYQLLGISPTERDTEVIEDAAIRQSTHVRTYQIGTHAELCQRVLNEIAQARQTILNVEKRREYDAKLPRSAKPSPKTSTAERAMKPRAAPRARSSKGMIVGLSAGGMAALAAAVGLIAWISQPEPKKTSTKGDLVAASEKKSPPNAVQPKPSPPKSTDQPLVEQKPKTPVAVVTPVVKEPARIEKQPSSAKKDAGPKVDPKPPTENPKTKLPEPMQPVATKESRPPPPDADTLAGKLKELHALIKMPDAKATAEDLRSHAEMLLGLAADTKKDPAMQFAMLHEAFESTYPLGDRGLSRQALVAETAAFRVEPLPMKLAALKRSLSQLSQPASFRSFVEAGDEASNEAISADDLELAEQIAAIASNAAARSKIPSLSAAAEKRLEEVRDLRSRFDAYKAAVAVRRDEPDNPKACLAVGRYLCLGRRDWDDGLKLLAKGSDDTLKAIAEKDLSRPASADDRSALGEAWAGLADKEQGTFRTSAGSRALVWLLSADADLVGLAGVKLAERISEIEKFAPLPKPPEPAVGKLLEFKGGHAAAFSSNGMRLAYDSDDAILIYDFFLNRTVRELRGTEGGIRSLAFSPDGRTLASGGKDLAVRLWDVASGQHRKLTTAPAAITPMKFSPDGRTLVFAAQDHTVHVWDVKSSKEIRTFRFFTGNNDIFLRDFSSDIRTAVSSSGSESRVRLWSVDKGKTAGQFDAKITHVYFAAISADNRFLLTGGGDEDNLVRIWDSVKFRELHRFSGLAGHVYTVRASADSRRVIAGSSSGEIRVWDIPPGKGDSLLGRQDEPVRLIEVSSDNRRIATGNQGRLLTVWGLPK